MRDEAPIHIIIAVLEGKASKAEGETLNLWRAESANNEDYYKSIRQTWLSSKIKKANFKADTEKALLAINKRMARRMFIKRTSYAAAILIICFASLLTLQLFQQETRNTFVAHEKTELILNDGTRVVLAEGSVLQYPDTFKNSTRKVQLQGKAYFEVVSNKNKPFIVETAETKTKVLGTKFTLQSNKHCADILFLDEGKVSFKAHGLFASKELLQPGEKAIYSNGAISKKVAINENVSSWASGILRFDNATLKEMLPILKQHYTTNIELKNRQLESLRFSGTLSQTKAQDALKVIALTLQLNLSENNQTLYLSL
ncbi:FecR family protein [Carboxylicivirga sp. N1Y90]|uniref:FecR family protein n=1 Tax=Carboxylicivirga fragile TaxID=3417571 RepID=UPI003D33901F|nr:FecR domain-containing protein [Marinilabiliaceae bacterium N1Y90]